MRKADLNDEMVTHVRFKQDSLLARKRADRRIRGDKPLNDEWMRLYLLSVDIPHLTLNIRGKMWYPGAVSGSEEHLLGAATHP